MKFHFFTSLVAFISLTANAETINLRFDDIPAIVRERNLHAQGADFLKQSAEVGRGHLARSYYPTVAATLGSERFKTGSQAARAEPFGSVTAKVNVFRGGRDLLEESIVDAKARATGAESEVTLRDEIKKARIRFWNLISQREIAKLLEEGIDENSRNLKAAMSRIRAGAATETDRIEFEMYKIELDQDFARLKLASENTERDLAVLLGLPEGSKIETPATVGHEHMDELLFGSFKVENSPIVSALTLRSEEAGLRSIQFARWWAPSVDLYVEYGLHTFREREFAEQAERFESIIGVQLTLDLFDGLSGRNERKQKALEAAGFLKESLQTGRELHAKIEGARSELKLTHELIHQSEEALTRAKTYLARTLDEYRRGVKNSPDVLSASERNFSIRRRFAELRRDYQLARSELLEILGQ